MERYNSVIAVVAENKFLRGKASTLDGIKAKLGTMPESVIKPPVAFNVVQQHQIHDWRSSTPHKIVD